MEEAYKFLKQKIYDFEQYINAMESYPEDYDENIYNDYVEELKEYKNILNELERLQRDNNALEMTHNYDIRMIDEVKGEYVKLSKEFKTLKNDSIPKQVIRDKFKRINETKIKIDKTNVRDYMIFGDTERATGWFINIDYIEKILLDVPGYKIGDE